MRLYYDLPLFVSFFNYSYNYLIWASLLFWDPGDISLDYEGERDGKENSLSESASENSDDPSSNSKFESFSYFTEVSLPIVYLSFVPSYIIFFFFFFTIFFL